MARKPSSSVRKRQKAQREERVKRITRAQRGLEKARKGRGDIGAALHGLHEIKPERYRTDIVPKGTFGRVMNNFSLWFGQGYRRITNEKLSRHGLSYEELQRRFPNLIKRFEGHRSRFDVVRFLPQEIGDFYKMYLFLKSKGISNEEMFR